MSSFPPHMVDARGRLLPSSFIPFCTYQTSVLGLTASDRSDLPFTACSMAQPTVLHGQLCYSINVTKISGNKRTKIGEKNGLLLVLDTGAETLKKEEKTTKQEWTRETTSIGKEKSNNHNTAPKIYVHTLSEFSNFGGGKSSYYTMSALKYMLASKSFMEFPDNTKNCQVEEMEKCQTKNYFKRMKEKCQCVPWVLTTFNTTEFNLSSTVCLHVLCVALALFRYLCSGTFLQFGTGGMC